MQLQDIMDFLQLQGQVLSAWRFTSATNTRRLTQESLAAVPGRTIITL
jgi:hypothetical protein